MDLWREAKRLHELHGGHRLPDNHQHHAVVDPSAAHWDAETQAYCGSEEPAGGAS